MDKKVKLASLALMLITSVFLVHSGKYKYYTLKLLPKETLPGEELVMEYLVVKTLVYAVHLVFSPYI